jgi:hypothetical protein
MTENEIIHRQPRSTREQNKDGENELETCYFTVLGMTCASCVDNIQRNLSKAQGMKKMILAKNYFDQII